MLDPGLICRSGENGVEMQAIGRGRRALVGALNALHRCPHVGQRILVADKDLGASTFKRFAICDQAVAQRPEREIPSPAIAKRLEVRSFQLRW